MLNFVVFALFDLCFIKVNCSVEKNKNRIRVAYYCLKFISAVLFSFSITFIPFLYNYMETEKEPESLIFLLLLLMFSASVNSSILIIEYRYNALVD